MIRALQLRRRSRYVVFVSDHGEMNMEHRQIWKNSMYEPSVRVPFQIAGPGPCHHDLI